MLNFIKNVKKGKKVQNNVRKPLLDISLHKNSWKSKKKVQKKVQKNEVITDRPTETDCEL